MSVHITCLTSAGGLPVFTRKKGDGENLPYSIIGSLNGVHMFSKSHSMDILHTLTPNHNVVWKEFLESVVLIGISTGSTVRVLNQLLESVFNAMVLVVGVEEISSQRNVERLKRELKSDSGVLQSAYPIIDKLLDAVDYGDSSSHSSDLLAMSEIILCQENSLIQVVVNSFAECVDSLYACLLVHGKISAATENWWALHPDERKLLAHMGALEHDSTAKDYPVFLPQKSPNIAFRLVSCTLIPDVVVCCLLGAAPSVEEVEQSACHCFRTTMEILRTAESVFPRNFPQGIQLDSAVLGILLISEEQGKYVLSRSTQQVAPKRTQNGSHRLDILRTFFYQAVSTFLLPNGEDGMHPAKETFWCSEYHKCHASKISGNILCVLYSCSVPTHAMRLLTQKTMKLLTADKQLCW